jgi:Porin subfamily
VKICSLYGAGFYYIPGTDTCIKIGGFVRAEVNFNAGGSFTPAFNDRDARTFDSQHWRSRAGITADARSQTEYGTLRSYVYLAATSDSSGALASGGNGASNGTGASAYTRLYAPAGFIQFAGFTAGKTGSFFDFDGQPYSNQSNVWSSNNGGNGIDLFAYTAQLGNGLSASIAAENNMGHRQGIAGVTGAAEAAGGESMPDIVGNLRIDQAWGSAQLMGAAHQVNYGVPADPSDKVGFAVGAGLKVNLPMLGKGDYIIGQFTYAKGAIDYVGSGLGQAQTVKQAGITSFGPGWDSVVTGVGSADLTTGWSFTGGYEHYWVPGWKSSLYGSYGKLEYTDAASVALLAATAGTTVGSSANWSYWQIGSRTVWTPVANLDLSVEVMYQSQQTGFAGALVGDNSWWSGMFRAQRNFYP